MVFALSSVADADESELENPLTKLKPVIEKLETGVNALKGTIKSKASGLKGSLISLNTQSYPYRKRDVSSQQSFDFERDVRPILDRKCVACHSCYEAPCRLNLASGFGLERGATKSGVYDGVRLTDSNPTRLHIDALSEKEWREKGFFSVLDPNTDLAPNQTGSLMARILELGKATPFPMNRRIGSEVNTGLDRANSCPAPDEFEDYAKNTVHGGMPFAVAGLTQGEFRTIQTWLQEGGKITTRPPGYTQVEQNLITQVEAWFNRTDDRSRLVSRYLFEHLFLAHLYLDVAAPGQTQNFFKLVRSSTPSGQPVKPIATVRPNDPPNGPLYYRLVPHRERIVHKTHITYKLDQKRLTFFDQLFFGSNWHVTRFPDYSETYKSNPFITFSDIPARARYQFLLNDAEFFVRNFIRGPVCNGQVATYVIRDQFWVMFQSPDHDAYVNTPAYQREVDPLLGVPGQKTSLAALGPEWVKYQGKRNDYLVTRQKIYAQNHPGGPRLIHIWDGDGTNTNAFLTVFRHHTNASVTRGWRGDFPLTAWVLDYPLLERTFYELVVGFDVFASVSHQVQTRLYFDLIRNEGETNFLELLPPASREPIYNDWYQFDGKLKSLIVYQKLDTQTETGIEFQSSSPKTELLTRLMKMKPQLTLANDSINRCDPQCQKNAETGASTVRLLSQLASKTKARIKGLVHLPEVTFLRIEKEDQSYEVYTILRNRQHKNVAFIFGESLRRQEELDTLTILPELVGSYPNMIFRIKETDLGEFVDSLKEAGSKIAFTNLVDRWGVMRMSPGFWSILHDFTRHTKQTEPLEAGIYDINRYQEW